MLYPSSRTATLSGMAAEAKQYWFPKSFLAAWHIVAKVVSFQALVANWVGPNVVTADQPYGCRRQTAALVHSPCSGRCPRDRCLFCHLFSDRRFRPFPRARDRSCRRRTDLGGVGGGVLVSASSASLIPAAEQACDLARLLRLVRLCP